MISSVGVTPEIKQNYSGGHKVFILILKPAPEPDLEPLFNMDPAPALIFAGSGSFWAGDKLDSDPEKVGAITALISQADGRQQAKKLYHKS